MNLSRNEKITLLLLLIGVLIVIYLFYNNKQENIQSITNDDFKKSEKQIVYNCTKEIINSMPMSTEYKKEIYTQFKNTQLNTLLADDGPFMREKYINKEINLMGLFNTNTRSLYSLNTFKNIGIADDDKLKIFVLYKNEDNTDNGIAVFDFNSLDFILYKIDNIDIIYNTYEKDNIGFGLKINNNNFYIFTQSTENITIDLILKLPLENGNITLIQYLNDKVKPIQIGVFIQKFINHPKINECVQQKINTLMQQVTPMAKPSSTKPEITDSSEIVTKVGVMTTQNKSNDIGDIVVGTQSLQPQSLQPQSLQPQSLQPQSLQPQSLQPPSALDIINNLKNKAVITITSSNDNITSKVLTDQTNTYFCIFEKANIFIIKYENNKLLLLYGSYYDIETVNPSSYRILLQNDGNLVLYYTDNSSKDIPFWSTGTQSFGPSSMFLDQMGNLIIKANNGSNVWNSQRFVSNGILKLQSNYPVENQKLIQEYNAQINNLNKVSSQVTIETVQNPPQPVQTIQTPQNVPTPTPIMSDRNQMCAEFIENTKKLDVELNQLNRINKEQLDKINRQDILLQNQNNTLIQQNVQLQELKQISDINNISYMATDKDYIYKLDSKDNIYYCKKPCDNKWNQIRGQLRQITSNGKDLYGVNSRSDIFTCTVPCANGNWKQIPGKLVSIDAKGNTLYGINRSNNIYSCDISKSPCNGNWRLRR